jgi:hypothetical protein
MSIKKEKDSFLALIEHMLREELEFTVYGHRYDPNTGDSNVPQIEIPYLDGTLVLTKDGKYQYNA